VVAGDVDTELRNLADEAGFPHRDAAYRALRFRATGDVEDLVAVHDDPHPCGMLEIIFAMAGSKRPWLNWVPMPTESICALANEFGGRLARGERIEMGHSPAVLSAAEPASAMTACQRVVGPMATEIMEFPSPDIRTPLRRGRYAVWRYDGTEPVPAVPAPSRDAVDTLHRVAEKPWPSMLSGYLQAVPLGELPLADLLGLLVHLPTAPGTPRWEHLARSTPTYWYRLMQPWVCLGILHHAKDEPWPGSIRREVLVDLAMGVEDWVADAALFALVTAAYREPEQREEVRGLVRSRLDAALSARRLVSIEKSLAQLMLVTPRCRADDRAVATAALSRAAHDGDDPGGRGKRRWWRRR
jgi:hypothetical protein